MADGDSKLQYPDLNGDAYIAENMKVASQSQAKPAETLPTPVPAGALQKPMDWINKKTDLPFNGQDTPGSDKSTFAFPGARPFSA